MALGRGCQWCQWTHKRFGCLFSIHRNWESRKKSGHAHVKKNVCSMTIYECDEHPQPGFFRFLLCFEQGG